MGLVLCMYSKDQFQAWLLSKEEGTYVGQTSSRCNCPLAMFYKAADPKYKQISMGKRAKSWQDGTGFCIAENADWEMEFIAKIDRMNRVLVSKEEALHALTA